MENPITLLKMDDLRGINYFWKHPCKEEILYWLVNRDPYTGLL